MATSQKHTVRSRNEIAEAYVDGLFSGVDWNVLHSLIRDGLEEAAFGATTVNRFVEACVGNLEMRLALRRTIVPDRSWKRRVGERTPLSASEIERMTDVGEVVREARRLYGGNLQAAEQLLTRPHRRFGGQAPILVAATEGGAQAVRELLARMEEGAPA